MSKKTPTNNRPKAKRGTSETERPKCGLIMPISAIDGLPPSHWEDVKAILIEAIASAGFDSELVSETEESTIIHKTIVQNLYNNPIVVCDVSGKNPNVMFELGVRLTFDKPTVVVKDDKTDYSFDMSPIEHVGYPRDLRFKQIVQFKEKLAAKVKSTYELAAKDPNYSTFLKHFGQFTVPRLEQKEVSAEDFIIKRLDELTHSVNALERVARSVDRSVTQGRDEFIDIPVGHLSRRLAHKIFRYLNHKYPDLILELTADKLRVYIPSSLGRLPASISVRKIVADVSELIKEDGNEPEDETPPVFTAVG